MDKTKRVIIYGDSNTEVDHVDEGVEVELRLEYDSLDDAQYTEEANRHGHVVGREGTLVIERYIGPYEHGEYST